VRSKRRAIDISISLQGINQTRKGVQELGRGWLFISPIKVWKSMNLLMLAYRKRSISKAEMHSMSICLLNIAILFKIQKRYYRGRIDDAMRIKEMEDPELKYRGVWNKRKGRSAKRDRVRC
jgi:hypothetical protein